MFIKKCEKRRHPYLWMSFGALALVGALSIKKMGADMLKRKWKRMTSALCSSKGSGCGCELQNGD